MIYGFYSEPSALEVDLDSLAAATDNTCHNLKHGQQLPLDRCPHCGIARPHLQRAWSGVTSEHGGSNRRFWATYACTSCGGVLLAFSPDNESTQISYVWPPPQSVAEVVPARAREFLTQAIASSHTPAGAVMLTASAVDAMLKDKGYKDGSLNTRIDAAAKNHLITDEMAAWAHEIRLDANDQRHADETAPLPSAADAAKVIEFTSALAQFLYVLPARVERGRKQ